MKQKLMMLIGLAAFALLIAGAVFAYDALREGVDPEILLTDQPGSITALSTQAEATQPGETEAAEPERIKAPDFEVEDSDGNSIKLSALEGTPVVLNFWASWCPPCKAEMPEFDSVYADLGGEVAFMMVNLTDGQRETKEKAADYISQEGYSFPVYYDISQEAAYAYGVRSIPTTIFIDSRGYVVTGAERQISEVLLRYGISLIMD